MQCWQTKIFNLPTKEQDGTVKRGGEVEGGVCVSFRCSPVTKITDDHQTWRKLIKWDVKAYYLFHLNIFIIKTNSAGITDRIILATPTILLALVGVSGSDGLRHLCGQRRGNRDEVEIFGPVMDGHLLATAWGKRRHWLSKWNGSDSQRCWTALHMRSIPRSLIPLLMR